MCLKDRHRAGCPSLQGRCPSSHTHHGQLALQPRKGMWKKEHAALPDHSMNARWFKHRAEMDYPQPRSQGSSWTSEGEREKLGDINKAEILNAWQQLW